MTSSTFTSTGLGGAAQLAVVDGTLDVAQTAQLSNSIIVSDKYGLDVSTNGTAPHLLIDNNTFKHSNSGTSAEVVWVSGGAPKMAIDSTLNGNAFCNQGAVATFTGIFNGVPDAAGSFVTASQYNAGVIYSCP